MGWAADEIPMPKGSVSALNDIVTKLNEGKTSTGNSYVVSNAGTSGFFSTVWPSGHGSAAANGEAQRLAGFLKDGVAKAGATSSAVGTYSTALATAKSEIGTLHETWDEAERNYNQTVRSLDPNRDNYEKLHGNAREKRDGIQGPLLRLYNTKIETLKTAARASTGKIAAVFDEPGPNKTSVAYCETYLRRELRLTDDAMDIQEAKETAAEIKKAQDEGNTKRVRELLSRLASYEDNPHYGQTLVKELGPERVLKLPVLFRTDRTEFTNKESWQASNTLLLRLLGNATASFLASGPEGTQFGTDLRALAKGPVTIDGTPFGNDPLAGHMSLGLLLASGKGWPKDFLVGAANDIYQHERQLTGGHKRGGYDPWGVRRGHVLADLISTDDAGHGDPMINALKALGRNDDAAREFFADNAGGADRDKLIYLIRIKAHGMPNGDGSWTGDNGASLGQALQAATRRHDGTEATSGAIAATMVTVIAGNDREDNLGELPYSGVWQPKAMREYTGHILAHYSHDLLNTYVNDKDLSKFGTTYASFDFRDLRAAMHDTFHDEGAYQEVMAAAHADVDATIRTHVRDATSYDGLSSIMDTDGERAGRGLGEIFAARGNALLDEATVQDQDSAFKKDLVHTAFFGGGFSPVPFMGPASSVGGEAWDRWFGEMIFPTDHASNTGQAQNDARDALARSLSESEMGKEIAARAAELHASGHPENRETSPNDPTKASRDFWSSYLDSLGNTTRGLDEGEPKERHGYEYGRPRTDDGDSSDEDRR